MTFQELLAAQVASGGQNVITPDNAGRILGLAAQQEANRRLALAEGQQAVQERKNLQAMQAGETPGVVTAPSGAKFVYDKQGNIVGTNALIGIGDSVDKMSINQGQATAQELALLGPAIRESFMLEMQKQAPKQPAKVEEKVTVQESPAQIPAVSTQPAVQATTPSKIEEMKKNKVRLENLLSASALPSEEQQTEDKSRASLYREMQKLQGELSSGFGPVEYADPLGGTAKTDVPMTPQMRAEAQQRVDQLREEIAKSGKRSSGISAKTATPKAKLEEYRALLEALARAQQ